MNLDGLSAKEKQEESQRKARVAEAAGVSVAVVEAALTATMAHWWEWNDEQMTAHVVAFEQRRQQRIQEQEARKRGDIPPPSAPRCHYCGQTKGLTSNPLGVYQCSECS